MYITYYNEKGKHLFAVMHAVILWQ